ncbi:MAG TPA: hypothetical protein VG013_34590 [Gemmataceae bacterium]|jgi:glycosyltransferase involved in cell wall biosynthesis|nr:hypothetical protein [Gemmataceae bacterium]
MAKIVLLAERMVLGLLGRILRRVPAAARNRPVKRSLWAGTPLLTLPVKARAERLLGVRADTLVYNTYFITDAFDYNLQRWMRIPVLNRLAPYVVLLWACLRYQRFHFFCDHGLLQHTGTGFNPAELRFLHTLGKELFFWTYGADVRTQERTRILGEFNCCLECPNPGRACICNDKAGQENMARLHEYATAVFAMGDMLEYTPGSRNDLFYWPLDLLADQGRRYLPRYPPAGATAPVRVVHAPNHRRFKGTRYLLAAVDRLRRQGLPVELRLVEGVPNREALEVYRTADVIFDQCLIGFHGYFALEAMAMGKPVMAYIRDPARYLLHPEECPLINTPADRVEAVLRELVTDRPLLHRLGRQGRQYVEKYFSVTAFAERLQTAYRELKAA